MTINEAKQLQPDFETAEAINDVLKHAGLIFEMIRLEDELNELIRETEMSGAKLCPKCGFICSGQCSITN